MEKNFTLPFFIILLDRLNGKWERMGTSVLGQCRENDAGLQTNSLEVSGTNERWAG
jgi:hypothetical protein